MGKHFNLYKEPWRRSPRHLTWRISKAYLGQKVVTHTIQRRIKPLGEKKVWKIYNRRKREGDMLYWGIQTPIGFSFYHSKEEYDEGKAVLAFFANDDSARLSATIKPGEDAALLLMAGL